MFARNAKSFLILHLTFDAINNDKKILKEFNFIFNR